jgi:CheY-like chemotaxis protein
MSPPSHFEENGGGADAQAGSGVIIVLRVLVIDDEDMIRKLMRYFLEQAGHRVDEARNGRIGIELLHTNEYDVIITDMVMPEMEGLEVISIAQRNWPHIPVVAVSGGARTGDADTLEIARDLGAAVVLPKPFGLRDLLAAVETAHANRQCRELAC